MYLWILIGSLILGIYLLLISNKIGIIGTRYMININIIINNIIIIYYLYKILIKETEFEININKLLDIGDWLEYNIIYINEMNIIMTYLVILISSIVIIYSQWYMKEESHIIRFLIFLLIFSSTMIIFINSQNLIMTYIGWEGVGIMSYLLINYWYNNINSNKSSMKAIFYNKIGDISLFIFLINNYINYNNTYIYSFSLSQNFFFSFIMIAVLAKSAQFIFLPWLGDAMAGPTPVSALLHAATMVTAGIYLLLKLNNSIIINNEIFLYIAIITVLISGYNSLFQNDIKKVIAYSTASQLGIMLIAILLNNQWLSFFHLFTHAFFKALLFLASGIIIHNLKLEQDMRYYGLLLNLPWSLFYFLISSLSLMSFPFFSGFHSKESIIFSSLTSSSSLGAGGGYFYLILGAILTILYNSRLFKKLFISYPNRININEYNNLYLLNWGYPGLLGNHPKGKGLFEIEELKIWDILNIFPLWINSIWIGELYKDYFISKGSNEFEFIYSHISSYLPLYYSFLIIYLPILIFIFIIIYLLTSLYYNPFKYWYLNIFYIIGNKRFFIDNFINLFSGSLFSFSYSLYKYLESNLFEPINLFRLFSSLRYPTRGGQRVRYSNNINKPFPLLLLFNFSLILILFFLFL